MCCFLYYSTVPSWYSSTWHSSLDQHSLGCLLEVVVGLDIAASLGRSHALEGGGHHIPQAVGNSAHQLRRVLETKAVQWCTATISTVQWYTATMS